MSAILKCFHAFQKEAAEHSMQTRLQVLDEGCHHTLAVPGTIPARVPNEDL